MKISIITAVLNNDDTIEDTIRSVLSQSYKNIEYIIIDGASSDGTLGIIDRYREKISKIVSEPDEGIYDALNKGIEYAKGEIIGFLHADDIYADDKVIEKVVQRMLERNVDSCYGDLEYVSRKDTAKTIRYWKSSIYSENILKKGWMPPHPTFFVKKDIYEKYGFFNADLKIAADYELIIRLLGKYKISTCYIPELLIKMRIGGHSNRNLKNLIIKSSEDYKAWKVNNLNGGLLTIIQKNLSKIPQFFHR